MVAERPGFAAALLSRRIRMRQLRSLAVLGFFLAVSMECFALPENYEIRAKYRDAIFGPKNLMVAFEPVVERQIGSDAGVSMQVIGQNDAFYLLFTNEEEGEYPLYSRGSYIIKRDIETGDFAQIKVFIRSEPGSYVRILPHGKRSKMDVFLMQNLLFRNVVLPMPLEQIVTEPFSRIKDASRYQVEWDLLSPTVQRPVDRTIDDMVTKLRGRLEYLRDADDGAMDSGGTFKLIEDLTENLGSGFNCSGFAKWVVDGLYLPRTGKLLPIEALKEKHLELRGTVWSDTYEESRDPYFGLDWSRNLAVSIIGLDAGSSLNPEVADVRNVPFFEYFEDVGYKVENVELILYLLARKDPGYFYVGSINREFGSDPVLRQHVHVLVLFPYFDVDGKFTVVIMERNVETGVASLLDRYANDYIHLVKIPASNTFLPPSVEF